MPIQPESFWLSGHAPSPFSYTAPIYAAVGWFSLGARRLQHWYTFIYKAILGGILPSSNSSWLRTESISDLMHGYVMYCRHSHPRGAKDAWLFMVHGLGMTSKRVLNLPHLSLCQGLKDSLRRNLRIPVIVFFLSRLFSFVKLCK